MSLRLVKVAGPTGKAPGARTGAAFLIVDGKGSVVSSQGWASLSSDPAPRRLAAGALDDPILKSIAEAVAESRKTKQPSIRTVEVSLERSRTYAVTAAPLLGGSTATKMAVAVQETVGQPIGEAAGKVIRQLGHDLRTPLTSISGAVELIQSGRLCPVQPQQERVLGMMQKGVDAMVRLIDEATAPYRRDLAADFGLDDNGELDEAPEGDETPEASASSDPAPGRSRRVRR